MDYTRKYNELKNIFDPGIREINIPDSEIRMINMRFFSDSVSDSINK